MGVVLENTFQLAASLPDSEALSRLNISGRLQWVATGCGRDGVIRKDARTSNCVFSTSRPPVLRENKTGGFKSQLGA